MIVKNVCALEIQHVYNFNAESLWSKMTLSAMYFTIVVLENLGITEIHPIWNAYLSVAYVLPIWSI